MNKSIESVWEKGFTGEMRLSKPHIKDLYNQKSNNLIDRFEALFAANHKWLIIGACLCGLVLSVVGAPILGAIIFLMFMGLAYFGKGQLKALQAIPKELSCLHYLQSFDTWLVSTMAQYTQIYRLFYPALFALCALRLVVSNAIQEVLGDLSIRTSTGQLEPAVFLAIAGISLLLGLFAGRIYRVDINLVYGAEIKKLKALIVELEELKTGE